MYSAKMQDMPHLDVIELESVVSHVARFVYKDRAVILNLSRVCFSNDNVDINYIH